MVRQDASWLPLISAGTLIVFYLVWAALHDIAHGEEGTIESIALTLCIAIFALLYRQALRVLPSKAKMAWLMGTGCLIALFSVGAANSYLHPKYPKDPLLAAAFLAAGLPALALIAFHLRKSARTR